MGFFKRTPLFYAMLYLLAIPLWAGFYTRISGDFYQSNVLKEGQAGRLQSSIREDLLKIVEEIYKRPQWDGQFILGGIELLKVIGVRSDQGTIVFETPFQRVAVRAYSNIQYRPVWTLQLPRIRDDICEVFVQVDRMPGFMLNKFKFHHDSIQGSEPRLGPLRCTEFEPEFVESNQPAKGSVLGILSPKEELYKKLEAYSAAHEGSPATVEGGYWRFLYFSIVTITTLGYGDIVPMTGWARGLVSAEAVFGILMVGLFLNAIAKPKS